MSATRVDEAVERLVARIVAGEFDERPLPREQDLAQEVQVSRLTLREAVKVLKTKGVLRVEQGRGTFANPVSRWDSVDLVARAAGATGDGRRTAEQLVEVRRFIETAATGLFAAAHSPDDLAGLRRCVERMRRADTDSDVAEFVEADLEFHQIILDGCGNPFVGVLFRPIDDLLRAARWETSSKPRVRTRAIAKHEQILAALSSGTREQAEAAMLAHIEQTREDL